MSQDNTLPITFASSPDEELEHHISSCWQMVTQEYEAGNRQGADYWRLAAQEAQKLRSPEQVTVDLAAKTAHEAGHWIGRWRVKGRAHEQEGRYTAEWTLGAMGWEIACEVFTEAAD